MGGCRCCFRQCPVATERNKGMHFFKFPTKNRQRLERWCELAGVSHFLNLTKCELNNKVICARHFPDNNFMNYKSNRLTQTATPILHRLSEELVLDYSNDADNPVLTKLPPITSPHLIPPEGFPNTMYFIAYDRKLADEVIKSIEEKRGPQSVRLQQKIEASKKPKLVEKDIQTADSCIVLANKNEDRLMESAPISNEIETMGTKDEIGFAESTEKNTQNDNYVLQHLNEKLVLKSIHQTVETPLRVTSNKRNYKSLTNMEDLIDKANDLKTSFDEEIIPKIAKNVINPKRRHYYLIDNQACKKPKLFEKNMPTVKSCVVLSNKKVDGLTENKAVSNKTKVMNADDSQTEAENYDFVRRQLDEEFVSEPYPVFSNKSCNVIEDQLTEDSERLEKVITELLESEGTVSDLRAKLDEVTHTNDELKTQLDVSVTQRTELSVKFTELKLKYDMLQLDHNDLQEKYTDLKREQESLKKDSQAQQKLTKIQLFNGIKKYLSQTMIALLRIQLSSGSEEREWKSDERQLAIDLMSLGEQVYKYFTDEWLIRLPPLRQVNSWRTEDRVLDEDDI